ncbi:MAG: metalloregulator ArsR/SmtB family transcription factor [Candidatus Paceibacterota bacterium]
MQSKPRVEKSYKRPSWVKSGEEELCPECFKAVGDKNRYKLICLLGRSPKGLNVTKLTDDIKLAQPTVTHHLNILREVNAVKVTAAGRERIYELNRHAHCFEDCQIPFN